MVQLSQFDKLMVLSKVEAQKSKDFARNNLINTKEYSDSQAAGKFSLIIFLALIGVNFVRNNLINKIKEMIMEKRAKNITIVVLGWMMFLSGCAAMPMQSTDNMQSMGREPAYQTMVAQQLRFKDLPVPAGFQLVRESSFVFQNNVVRMGTLNYIGKAEIDTLIDFYKRHMALQNWNLMNSVEFGKVMLNFEKDKESCIVTLEKKGGQKTLIILNLSPISDAGVKDEKNGDDAKDASRKSSYK